MPTLTLELAPEVYAQLQAEAERLGKPAESIVTEWLVERLPTPVQPAPALDDEREKVRAALRAAGLLTELGPNLKKMADPTISLDEVIAAMSRVEGQSLSDIVLEQRGPKEQ